MENNNILLKFVKFIPMTSRITGVKLMTTSHTYIHREFVISLTDLEDILIGKRPDTTYYKVDNVLHIRFNTNEVGDPILTQN